MELLQNIIVVNNGIKTKHLLWMYVLYPLSTHCRCLVPTLKCEHFCFLAIQAVPLCCPLTLQSPLQSLFGKDPEDVDASRVLPGCNCAAQLCIFAG